MPDGLDLSIYNNVGKVPNMLTSMGEAVGLANQVQQNKLLGLREQQMTTDIDAAQLKLKLDQLNTFHGMLAPLVGKKDVTGKDIWGVAQQVIQQKLAPAASITAVIAGPNGFPMKGTPEERQAWVLDKFSNVLSAQQNLEMALGPVKPFDTGGGTTFIQQPMRPDRTSRQVGSVPYTMGPGSKYYDQGTRQERTVTQGSPGQFQPPVPNPDQPASRGVNPPPLRRPDGAGAPPVKAQDRVPPVAGMRTAPAGPPLGEGEAANVAGRAAGGDYGSAMQRAANYQREIYPLEKSLAEIERLGPTKVGPGAETVSDLKSFLITNVPGAAKAFEGTKNDVESFDVARKLMTQMISQGPGGAASAQHLAAAFSGNPNMSISQAANSTLLKATLALRKMEQAQHLAFIESGRPESEFNRFGVEFNRKQDPRAYGVEKMGAKEFRGMLDRMKDNDAERKKFASSLETAISLGLVNRGTVDRLLKGGTNGR